VSNNALPRQDVAAAFHSCYALNVSTIGRPQTRVVQLNLGPKIHTKAGGYLLGSHWPPPEKWQLMFRCAVGSARGPFRPPIPRDAASIEPSPPPPLNQDQCHRKTFTLIERVARKVSLYRDSFIYIANEKAQVLTAIQQPEACSREGEEK